MIEISGERGRNRTYNLLIKSQLLCQLSYAPVAFKTSAPKYARGGSMGMPSRVYHEKDVQKNTAR